VAFGLTAALMSGMTAAFDHGIVGVLSAWQTWLMVLTGGLAMFLLQNALQAGRLIAAQPGITIADPIVAIGWGVTAFGERVHSGGWIAGEVIGALAMAGCAVLLSASRSSEDT
jgi:drug/metabolite transporter (DMT)-like permease